MDLAAIVLEFFHKVSHILHKHLSGLSLYHTVAELLKFFE